MIIIKNDCHGYLPGGFGSKFLVVLDWVHNSIYNKEKVLIDWTCKNALDHNLWDLFFEQPKLEIDETGREIVLDHYRHMHMNYVYPKINESLPMFTEESGKLLNKIELFSRDDFQIIRDEFHKAWQLITVKKDFLDTLKEYESQIDEKTLGITVRIPAHYCYEHAEGTPLSNKVKPEKYYDKIVEELVYKLNEGFFQKIFVACDVQYFIDLLIKTFGEDKIIFTKYSRLTTLNRDWVEKKLPLSKEYEFVLRDVLLLSKCNYIMGGTSNLFSSALFINNQSKFEFFKILKNLYGY